MRAACIQLCSGAEPAANIALASELIRKAANDGAVLVTTPEMTGLLQRKPKRLWDVIATQEDDICVKAFGELANELGIYLLIGSLAILTGQERAANRCFLFGPDGKIITTYDKIHLFDVVLSRAETWRESAIYDAGKKGVTADIDGARLGLSICYDLRFAALYRSYAAQGAHILTVPAAFTRPTGQAHWETLLRARAIETGSYVLAPAQGGDHEDGRSTWGHSMIVDPWGQVVAKLEHDAPGYITAELDLEAVKTARSKVPAWQHNPDYEML